MNKAKEQNLSSNTDDVTTVKVTKPTLTEPSSIGSIASTVKIHMEDVGQQFIFVPNDKDTRAHISNMLCERMYELCNKGIIHDFRVVCDETNNSPFVVASHKLVIDTWYDTHGPSAQQIRLRATVGPVGPVDE